MKKAKSCAPDSNLMAPDEMKNLGFKEEGEDGGGVEEKVEDKTRWKRKGA